MNIREFFEDNVATAMRVAANYTAATFGLETARLPVTQAVRRMVSRDAAQRLASVTYVTSVIDDDDGEIYFAEDFINWVTRDGLAAVYEANIERAVGVSLFDAILKGSDTHTPKIMLNLRTKLMLNLRKVRCPKSYADAILFTTIENFSEMDGKVVMSFHSRFKRAMENALYDVVFPNGLGEDEIEFVKFVSSVKPSINSDTIGTVKRFLFDQVNGLGDFAIPSTFDQALLACARIAS